MYISESRLVEGECQHNDLIGPGSQTMAVAMFDLWGNGQGPELAALGLVWSLAMTCVAVLFYFVARRSGGGLRVS
jgi:iron(III) transport system permease protein